MLSETPWVPPTGHINFKLIDASNLYADNVGTTGATALPRTDAFSDYPFTTTEIDGLKSLIEGTRDFTAFTITSFNHDSGANDMDLPEGVELTGIVTFLEVGTLEATNFAGGLINLDLVDDSSLTRGQSGAEAGTVRRFFLFDTSSNPNSGKFDLAGGRNIDVQWFDSSATPTRVSSNGTDFVDIDLLSNFTIGTAGTDTVTSNLVLTGNGSARTANVNAGAVSGNVVVIAARTSGDDGYTDRFKLKQLVTQGATTTGIYENKATVTVPGDSDNDLSHYKNSPPPPPVLGSIAGTKYLDITGNSLTNDDTPLGGVTIKLYKDSNNNGQYDSGTDQFAGSTVTAGGTGAYSFANLAVGTYFVMESLTGDYVRTYPTTVDGIYKVTLAAGEAGIGGAEHNRGRVRDAPAPWGIGATSPPPPSRNRQLIAAG